MLQPKEIYERFTHLFDEKSERLLLMDEIDDYFESEDNVLTGTKQVGSGSPASQFTGELLDTTGSDLIDEYVSYVLGLYFVSESRWFTLRYMGAPARDDVARILSARADHLHTLITKSNYFAQAPRMERDVVLHGHGIMMIERDDEFFARSRTIDPRNFYMSQDRYNRVKFCCWEERMKGYEILDKFPSARAFREIKNKLENTTLSDYNLLTCYMKAEEPFVSKADLEAAGQERAKYVMRYLAFPLQYSTEGRKSFQDAEVIDLDEVDYYKYNILFPARDIVVRDYPYGQGIGRKALPKARILNKMMNSLLRLSALQANPPRTQDSGITVEGGLNEPLSEGQVFTVPSDLLSGEPSRGKHIELLQVTGDLKALIELYAINQGQLASMLPTAGSIYKVSRQSINEIQQRLAEQEKRLAPLRANYVQEALIQHLKLFYEIANEGGEFNNEELRLPEGVNIRKMDFVVDAHLMTAFKQNKALRAAQALGVVANFLSIKPTGGANIDIDKIVEVGFDGFNCLDLLVSREEVRKEREAQAQRIQEQQALQEQQVIAQKGADHTQVLKALESFRNA